MLFLERSSLAGPFPEWKTNSFRHNSCWWQPVTARQSVSIPWVNRVGSRIQNWALKRTGESGCSNPANRGQGRLIGTFQFASWYLGASWSAEQSMEKESAHFPGVWERVGWRPWLSKALGESLRYTRWDLSHCLKLSTDVSALSNRNSYDIKYALNFKMLFWIEFRDNIHKNMNHRYWFLFMYYINWSLISREFFY